MNVNEPAALTETMKTRAEIAAAHDAITEFLAFEPAAQSMTLAHGVHNVLCWVLGHGDHGPFAELLDSLRETRRPKVVQ